MTFAFWGLAAVLAGVALLFLLPPLLRRRAPADDPRAASNAEVYREQLAELESERARGTVDSEEYARARRDIDRRAVTENAQAGAATAPRRATRTAIGVALVLPLAAVLFYLAVGNPHGLDPRAAPQDLPALTARLQAHLEKSPEDAEAWALLGRALGSLGHYERAAQSLARSLQLDPEQREVLVDFVKTLAMAGRTEFEARNYDAAIAYWERILPFAPEESDFAKTVRESIADARQAAGGAAPLNVQTSIQGVVSLSPALKEKVGPQDTVFILARAPGGSRMPLAATRTTVDKLPFRFTLDDSMAMMPTAKLSAHPKVVVIARISKSGDALPRKGDIEGVSAPVAPGATGVAVELSKVVP